MVVEGKLLHDRSSNTFSGIHGDRNLLKKITADMLENGGKLAPILHWQIIEKDERELQEGRQYSDNMTIERYEQAFEAMYQSSDQFLDAWIGSIGCQKWTDDQLKKILPFLERVDAMGLFAQMQTSPTIDWRYTDLGTVININCLNCYLKADFPYILEVGGGYGRLAEAVMNIFSGVKYVMLDAVPGSLMFAYLYLREQLPQKKIGFYYSGDPFDMDLYDLYICPSWHFERLNHNTYDAAINLSSFQEMGQAHVDYYIDLFDRSLARNGIIYLQNSRDYVFKGTWNYPKTWERLYMYNDPMSWTEVYPVEVFRKQETAADHINSNALIEAGYFYSVESQRQEKEHLRGQLTAQKEDSAALSRELFTILHDIQPESEASTPHQALQRLSDIVIALQGAFKEERKRSSELEAVYDAVLHSKSWKITAPLRSLLRFFKRK